LQRTKAETVSKHFDYFFQQFPSWKSICETPEEKLQEVLKPFGLYKQRSKRLKGLAMIMFAKGGRVHKTQDGLSKFPMMGQYISYTTMSVVNNKPYPMLDVNMVRFIERYFGKGKLVDHRYDSYIQNIAFKLVKHNEHKFINWAILDFGASVCKKRDPKCHNCIFKSKCNYAKLRVDL